LGRWNPLSRLGRGEVLRPGFSGDFLGFCGHLLKIDHNKDIGNSRDISTAALQLTFVETGKRRLNTARHKGPHVPNMPQVFSV